MDYSSFLGQQEEIFYLALGYYPELGKRYFSPFRDDNNPGCYFKWHREMLFFIDNSRYEDKLFWSCFDVYSKLQETDLNTSLQLIHKNVITNKKIKVKNVPKKRKLIQIESKPFSKFNYFTQFNITQEQLEKDEEVFLCKNYWIDGDINKYGMCPIAYKVGNSFKLYFPYSKIRFFSNCTNNDIFNFYKIYNYNSEIPLFITKSKKDCLVLENYGLQVIATQNEGCLIPDYLLKTIQTFKTVIIWFDNDKTGVKEAKKLSRLYGFEYIYLPKIYKNEQLLKDPSDWEKNNIKWILN